MLRPRLMIPTLLLASDPRMKTTAAGFHLSADDIRPFVGRDVSLNRRLPEGFLVVEDAARQAAEESGATLEDYHESAPGVVHIVLAEEE